MNMKKTAMRGVSQGEHGDFHQRQGSSEEAAARARQCHLQRGGERKAPPRAPPGAEVGEPDGKGSWGRHKERRGLPQPPLVLGQEGAEGKGHLRHPNGRSHPGSH